MDEWFYKNRTDATVNIVIGSVQKQVLLPAAAAKTYTVTATTLTVEVQRKSMPVKVQIVGKGDAIVCGVLLRPAP